MEGGGCLRSIAEEEFQLMGIKLTRPGQFVLTGKGLDECVLLVMVGLEENQKLQRNPVAGTGGCSRLFLVSSKT